MADVIRNCAGGAVFFEERLFLLKSDKNEWVLPKGVIRGKAQATDVALERVRAEAGIRARIVERVGDTKYEFFSLTRKKSVCNVIHWFAMMSDDGSFRIAFEQGFLDGDYYPIETAFTMLTHPQDAEIARRAWAAVQAARIGQ